MKLVKNALFLAILAASCSANASFFVSSSASYDGKADFKNSDENVEISSFTINAGTDFLTLTYKRTDFDWSNDYNLDTLHYLYADLHHSGEITKKFTYHAGIGLAAGFEDDFHADENYSIAPRLAIGYKFNNDFSFFGGAYAQFNEADNKFMPIIGMKYRNDDALGFSGSIAYPATKANYKFNDFISANATLLVHKEFYQLSDNSSFAKSGYVFDESVGTSLGVTLNPLSMLSIDAGVNCYFEHEYTLYNHNGDEIGSLEVDPSLGGYVNVRARF